LTHPIIPEYGDYDMGGRVRMDATIALANSDPMLLARGLIKGAGVVHKFGASTTVGTAFKPITTSQTYQTPKVAEALEVVSDSTDDNGTTSPLGSGALKIRVYGITLWDAGEVTEEVVLDGTTPVSMATSFLRVYRVKVIESGTYADATSVSHNSLITIRGVSVGVLWAQVTSQSGVGLGQSEVALYAVGAGKVAYMPTAEAWIEAQKAANLIFFVRDKADVVVAPYSVRQAKIIMRNVIDAVHVEPKTPYGPFIGPCDLGWMGMATSQTANIGVDFELIVYDV